jgi:pantoate--beta-alanine ligase
MDVVSTLAEWRQWTAQQRARGASVGLVATMGALHKGHGSLVERAVAENDVVVMSVFVNPRQFNDVRDLERYPRTPERDRSLAAMWGVDLLVEPSTNEMWPAWPAETPTVVSVRRLSEEFEGAGRPGHFDGVASVVTKLFVTHGPGRAYFGEKDFQQLALVRQLNGDLGLGMTVIGCPTIRDEDGLALSSRNVLLSDSGRRSALAVSATLKKLAEKPRKLKKIDKILSEGLRDLDVAYAVAVEPGTLRRVDEDYRGTARVLIAVHVDGVRLIDNADVELDK